MEMATIFTRRTKAGVLQYYGDITVSGKRYRRYLGLSKVTAQIALKKLEYELRFNTQGNEDETISYSAAITKFLVHVELTGITYSQIKYIASRLRYFQRYCANLGIKELPDIDQDSTRSYLTLRMKEHITKTYNYAEEQEWKHPAISTINREIGFQKRFFRFCVDNGWIIKNPWATVTRLNEKKGKEPRYSFSMDDLERIFSIAGPFHDFYHLLLHTGLRPTDVFALDASCFSGNLLTLRQRKTGDWLQNIPVSQSVMELISIRVKSGELLFPELQSDRQRRKARRQIQSLFEPEFVRKNNINLHTFRHTYAHHMLNKGMPKEVLQTFLGHRSIRTTEIYANWVNNAELSKWVT